MLFQTVILSIFLIGVPAARHEPTASWSVPLSSYLLLDAQLPRNQHLALIAALLPAVSAESAVSASYDGKHSLFSYQLKCLPENVAVRAFPSDR